jgi:uncharacterized protein YndB with AHSA1/START domain
MTDGDPFDLELAHVFDAPRERLYRAFTDPDLLARWYGPTGFSVPRDSVDVDLRPGGHVRLVMVHDADEGLRSSVNLRLTEVVEPELLDGAEDWECVPGQAGTWSIRHRAEFHDQDGRTRLVLREGPHPPGRADLGRQAWQMMFARLAAVLEAN